jgi:hypothetical protein
MPHLCLVKQLSIYMETPGQGGHYRAKARSLRLCEKRLTRVNLEYTECAREIMALEEKYPIVSSRKVSALPRPGPSSRPPYHAHHPTIQIQMQNQVQQSLKEAILETPVTADALK